MSDTVLGPATEADGPAILGLLERSSLPTVGLSDHLANAVVARRDGQIVGSAALEIYADGALLRSVAVDATERGGGLGQRLTERALTHARERHVCDVYLLTTTAAGFFPRFGFREISRADVPAGVQQSVEFRSACPASAIVMHAPLRPLSVAVRDATESDLAAITAIFNDVLATSTAIYMDQPVTLADRAAWWRSRVDADYPVLVAQDESGIVGFASFGPFRAPVGYRFTVEQSVYVRNDRRGRGIGGNLVRALVERARRLGTHTMIAGVDADNAASLRFHERLGFERVAHFREVGYKFGRWLDLIFLQRSLGKPDD